MNSRATTILIATALAGCAWKETPAPGAGVSAPATFPPACGSRQPPQVESFGSAGVRAVYHFVIQDAAPDELGALLRNGEAQGFRIIPMTMKLNGVDTLFGTGPAILRNQAEARTEFRVACALGRGNIYVTHARYNPAEEKDEQVRVR